MKHLKKFNESLSNVDNLISDIFKWHSYYIWGIEFDLTDFPDENTDLGDSLSKMT